MARDPALGSDQRAIVPSSFVLPLLQAAPIRSLSRVAVGVARSLVAGWYLSKGYPFSEKEAAEFVSAEELELQPLPW